MWATQRHEVVTVITPENWGRDALIVGGMVALVLALPAVIHGYLSYRQFDFFRFTYYFPYEEMFAAFRSYDVGAILDAPILSANMTSGFLIANVYAVKVQQLLLSGSLGVLMGLNLVTYLNLCRVCPQSGATGGVAAGGTGLLTTVAASSTGILGCGGSALGGGVLALAGIGANTAAEIAGISPLLQLFMVAAFAVSYAYLRRKLRNALLEGQGPLALK